MNVGSTTLNGVTISAGSTVQRPGQHLPPRSSGDDHQQRHARHELRRPALHRHQLSGNVTLNGTGTLTMSNNPYNQIYGSAVTNQLTNGAGHTIEGSGQLGAGPLSLINNGTILANQSNALTIKPERDGCHEQRHVSGQQRQHAPGRRQLHHGGNGEIGQVGSQQLASSRWSGRTIMSNRRHHHLWTSGSTLSVGREPFGRPHGGTLQGIGTISGNLSNTGGTILPGTPGEAGILTVTGRYSDPQGSLDIQIGGLTPGTGFSQLKVPGDASLGGTLEVSLINGFTPPMASIRDPDLGGLNGMFTDNVIQVGNFTFTATYINNDTDVLLTVGASAVPEPSSLVMLAIGIAGAGACIARRRGKPPNRENSAEKGTF